MSLDFSLNALRMTGVYSGNITHNLSAMAREAGVYEVLWRPDEHGYTHASQLIPVLEDGIDKMSADPARFEKFDSPNGWGVFENLVGFCEEVLEACRKNPDAEVSVCR